MASEMKAAISEFDRYHWAAYSWLTLVKTSLQSVTARSALKGKIVAFLNY